MVYWLDAAAIITSTHVLRRSCCALSHRPRGSGFSIHLRLPHMAWSARPSDRSWPLQVGVCLLVSDDGTPARRPCRCICTGPEPSARPVHPSGAPHRCTNARHHSLQPGYASSQAMRPGPVRRDVPDHVTSPTYQEQSEVPATQLRKLDRLRGSTPPPPAARRRSLDRERIADVRQDHLSVHTSVSQLFRCAK